VQVVVHPDVLVSVVITWGASAELLDRWLTSRPFEDAACPTLTAEFSVNERSMQQASVENRGPRTWGVQESNLPRPVGPRDAQGRFVPLNWGNTRLAFHRVSARDTRCRTALCHGVATRRFTTSRTVGFRLASWM